MVESVSIWTHYRTVKLLVEAGMTASCHGVAYIQLVEGRAFINDTFYHCEVHSSRKHYALRSAIVESVS